MGVCASVNLTLFVCCPNSDMFPNVAVLRGSRLVSKAHHVTFFALAQSRCIAIAWTPNAATADSCSRWRGAESGVEQKLLPLRPLT